MDDSIFWRWCRDGKVGVAEFNCIGDDLALGVSIDKFEAAVGIQGRSNVKAILSTKVPRPLGGWFGMDENPTTNWA
jgi:hypothetical protein